MIEQGKVPDWGSDGSAEEHMKDIDQRAQELAKEEPEMKLSIELVPASSWYNNVRESVSRKLWDVIRKAVYKRANFICEICGASKSGLNAHEQWEYNNGIQKLIGLICLCSDCHSVKHFGLAKIKGRMQEAQDHFCDINDIDNEVEAEEYIEKAVKLWEQRSQVNWELDKESIDEVLQELQGG